MSLLTLCSLALSLFFLYIIVSPCIFQAVSAILRTVHTYVRMYVLRNLLRMIDALHARLYGRGWFGTYLTLPR